MGGGGGGVPTVDPTEQSMYKNLVGPGSQQIYNTAFDPQLSLYNYLSAQNRDATNVASSMAGVSNSPYAAGISAQQQDLFNQNWQNQQLQRQATGLGAINQGVNAGSGMTSAAAQAEQANTYAQTAPMQAFGQLGSAILGK